MLLPSYLLYQDRMPWNYRPKVTMASLIAFVWYFVMVMGQITNAFCLGLTSHHLHGETGQLVQKSYPISE